MHIYIYIYTYAYIITYVSLSSILYSLNIHLIHSEVLPVQFSQLNLVILQHAARFVYFHFDPQNLLLFLKRGRACLLGIPVQFLSAIQNKYDVLLHLKTTSRVKRV